MDFMPNDQDNGHIHGIVHDNVSIFDTFVYLGVEINIDNVSFKLFIKVTFYLLSAKSRLL